MSKLIIPTISLIFLLPLGCEGYKQGVRDMTHSMGGIMSSDVRSAKLMEDYLPGYLDMSPKQIKILPGSGVTHLQIRIVCTPAQRQQIDQKILYLNKRLASDVNQIKLTYKKS